MIANNPDMKNPNFNATLAHDAALAHKWPAQKAASWMQKHGWLAGCNYVPQNAINQLEMWQAETFDPFLIDKELGWAESLGFNTVRVFLHHLVWDENPQAYLYRINQYLSIAHKHGIKTMFVLFDAVWDPFPKLGKQPEPRPNVHNSGWVQCPGFDVLNNPARYDDLQHYVQGIVGAFQDDERVLNWDLFNEPDNMNTASYKDDNYAVHKAELSMQLLKKTISWVREINPVQPITMAPWQYDWSDHHKLTALDNYMFTHSDIISFHCYERREGMEQKILQLKRYERPMLCTEYMARAMESTFEDIMPLLKKHNVGAYNWGFVAGKSQTHCPWQSWHEQDAKEPEVWFHDILKPDGKPYDSKEVAFIKRITRSKRKVFKKEKVTA